MMLSSFPNCNRSVFWGWGGGKTDFWGGAAHKLYPYGALEFVLPLQNCCNLGRSFIAYFTPFSFFLLKLWREAIAPQIQGWEQVLKLSRAQWFDHKKKKKICAFPLDKRGEEEERKKKKGEEKEGKKQKWQDLTLDTFCKLSLNPI